MDKVIHKGKTAVLLGSAGTSWVLLDGLPDYAREIMMFDSRLVNLINKPKLFNLELRKLFNTDIYSIIKHSCVSICWVKTGALFYVKWVPRGWLDGHEHAVLRRSIPWFKA